MSDQESQLENAFHTLSNLIKDNDYANFCEMLDQFPDINYQENNNTYFPEISENNIEKIVHKRTLLHICITYSNYPALVQILSKGGKPNIGDSDQITPLHLAIWKGSLHLAATLLQCGANPDAIDSMNRTPLYFAIARLDPRAVRLLLTFNANPNAIQNGKSMLAYAAERCFPEAILMLMKAGAEPNVGNNHPLVEAIKHGNRECLGALLYNHERDILDKIDGKSILEIALEEKSILLPLIVSLTKNEIQKMKDSKCITIPPYPPENLKYSERKRLKIAEQAEDIFLQINKMNTNVHTYICPWKPIETDNHS